MFAAVVENNARIISSAIDLSADVNQRLTKTKPELGSFAGFALLHVAAMIGNLRHSARPSCQDRSGTTPLVAISSFCSAGSISDGATSDARALINARANVNEHNEF